MLNKKLIENETINQLRKEFYSARPFPNLIIDDFLNDELADQIFRSFPRKSRSDNYQKYCRQDDGALGLNYSCSALSNFPEPFKVLSHFLQSEILEWCKLLIGDSQLQFDPDYQGGGIKRSQSSRGMHLPCHLDFNKHPRTGLYRTINILIYFNKDWQEQFGGNLSLYNNEIEQKSVTKVIPTYNRAVIFETSERSWHGFNTIKKDDKGNNRYRETFSVYFYSPKNSNIPTRNTEYYESPLPSRFCKGYKLTDDDLYFLKQGFARRDSRIRLLDKMRREFDSKYSYLWKEYEYYLEKFNANKL